MQLMLVHGGKAFEIMKLGVHYCHMLNEQNTVCRAGEISGCT